MNSDTEEKLRQGFRRYLNPFMRTLFRLGLAGWFNVWPEVSGRIMVIVHTGRKTGRRRLAPVNYAVVDGDPYCVAGFGPGSDWYRNIVARPAVEVWMPEGWWAGVVEDVSDSPDRVRLMREVMIGSGFAARAVGMNPRTMSDEQLAADTAKYRLMRIRRMAPCTGPGGPGDLAWVWPVATMILALAMPLAFRRSRKKR